MYEASISFMCYRTTRTGLRKQINSFSNLGGAFSTAAAQAAFVNRLIVALSTAAPGLDSSLVIAAGASELRTVFSASELPGIPQAYLLGIKGSVAVSLAFAGVACLCTLAVPMRKLPTHGVDGATMGMA